MTTKKVKKIKIQSPEVIAFIKKRLEEKEMVRDTIRKGKSLKKLEKDGIRFITPL